MYVPSLRFGFAQRVHVFSQSLNLIEHHKLFIKLVITILAVIAVMGLGAVWQPSGEHQLFTSDKPFTRLDDPQYAHEYDTRAQYIYKQLDMLKDKANADRAYAVSYRYGPTGFGDTTDKIASTFEVGLAGLDAPIKIYQDLPRMNWLQLKQNQCFGPGLLAIETLPRNYGMELYAPAGEAIGYVGITYRRDNRSFPGNPIEQVFQEAALSISTGLLQPMESLNNLGEQ